MQQVAVSSDVVAWAAGSCKHRQVYISRSFITTQLLAHSVARGAAATAEDAARQQQSGSEIYYVTAGERRQPWRHTEKARVTWTPVFYIAGGLDLDNSAELTLQTPLRAYLSYLYLEHSRATETAAALLECFFRSLVNTTNQIVLWLIVN